MFHFPGCPPHELWIHSWVTGHCPGRVPPFGYPWINAYLRLPRAFRSLSRPSLAISALASTLRSSSLDLISKRISHKIAPVLFPLRRLLRLLSGSGSFFWIALCLPCAVFKVRPIQRFRPEPVLKNLSALPEEPFDPSKRYSELYRLFQSDLSGFRRTPALRRLLLQSLVSFGTVRPGI